MRGYHWMIPLYLVGTAFLAAMGLTGVPGYADACPDFYEVDDTAAEAVELRSGTSQYRNIHTPGDVDWAWFRINRASQVVVETSGFGGDTVMELYGPNSSTRKLERDDDDGSGSFSKIERLLIDPGDYYVRINEFLDDDTIEDYTLRLTVSSLRDAFEPDNHPANAHLLLSGTPQSRSLDVPQDVDWARFTLQARSDVLLKTSGPSGDTEMTLFGPGSTTREVARDNDGGGGAFSQITQTGLAPGDYYVRIAERGQNDLVPAYSLRLQSDPSGDPYEPDDIPESASSIAINTLQTRSLDVAADLDWVRFHLTRQSKVTVETSGTYGDTELFLFGPGSSMAELAQDEDGGSGLFSRIELAKLPPGDYYLRVQAHEGSGPIPSYSLRVDAEAVGDQFEPDDADVLASTLPVGDTQTRSLDPAGDVDWVQFNLVRDGYAVVEAHAPGGGIELSLFETGPSTVPIEEDDGSGQISRVSRPQMVAGTYHVRVRSAIGLKIPAYTLTLLVSDAFEPDDSPLLARTLTMGEVQERSLHQPGDVDWVRFELTAESPVTLETSGTAGDTELALFAEEQVELPLSEDDNGNGTFSRIQMESLAPGSYLVRVRAPGGASAVGRYRLRLTNADRYEPDDAPNSAAAIGPGEIQVRSLAPGTDLDWVRLTLTAPTRLVFETAGTNGNTELLLFSAIRPDRKLASDNNSGTGQFSRIRKKLKPGTYLLQVRSFRARGGISRYTLSVTTDTR